MQDMTRTLRYLFVLLFVSIAGAAFGQTGEIYGTVLDEKKEPMIGAVVQVEQGGIVRGGAPTDIDGNYSIKPLQPGTYDVRISSTGYKVQLIHDVLVSPNASMRVNKAMEVNENALKGITVIAESEHRPPIVGSQGATKTFTAKDLHNFTSNNLNDAAATQIGVVQAKSGGSLNIGGARTEGTLYIIDGVQVQGNRYISQSRDLVEQMQVLTSGIPAKYGDASGGVITITTRGVSRNFRGGLSYEHSVEGYNTNFASFNLSGPFFSKKDSNGLKHPVVGFVLAGDYRYDVDNDPTYEKNAVIKSDVLKRLQDNPLVSVPNSTGVPTLRPATEFVTNDDMETQKARVNALSKRASLTGKLDYQVSENANLTVGGSFFYTDAYNYSRRLALFAPDAVSQAKNYTGRGYIRFTQRFSKSNTNGEDKKDDNDKISNAFYSVQADYQRDYSSTQDPNHKHDPFAYSYVGKFYENANPVYSTITDTATGKTGIGLLGYSPTGVTFQRSEVNPLLANYTSQYYNLGAPAPLLLSSINSSGTYLRNGDGPNSVYSLWNNVGTAQGGYSYGQADQFSVGIDASFDYKHNKTTHAVEFGLYYQQRAERSYGVSGAGLWGLMRQLTHRAVDFGTLDYSNPIFVINGQHYTKDDVKNGVVTPGPNDTILYNRAYNDSNYVQGNFDYNLRKKLGLDPKSRDYLQPDNMDPSMFSLDMFTPDELLNSGNPLVSYYGYDYTGKIINGQVNFNDYFTKKDANGNYTRPIGAYRPNYIAGYISDNIRFKKDILFSLGVRVERFDNNTKVLKDPYSLYETHTAGESGVGALNLLNGGQNPGNIGSSYVAYVGDNSSSKPAVIGYRDGDTWYDAYGREVSDPTVLKNYSGGRYPQPYLVKPSTGNAPKITDANYDPNASFTDYKPQVNAMPRIAFSFPVSEVASFYAHYDVVMQRPKPASVSFATPNDYYFLSTNANSIIGNPDLKPEKLIDYEVGFEQKLTDLSAVTLSGFYKERKDQIQVRPYLYAWPNTYFTYGNRDYSTTKGLGLRYELRRVNHLQLNLSYTLQFAEGTGSGANSSNGGGGGAISSGGLLQYLISAQLPNLRFPTALSYDSRHLISATIDYRYGMGEGPELGGTHFLQNTGLNFLFTARSGEPYTRYANAQTLQGGVNPNNLIEGGINGSRLPWHYMMNVRLDKDFALSFGKKKECDAKRKPVYSLNAYLLVQNLLNTKDVLSVYPYTGRADDDGYLTSAAGNVTIGNQTNAKSFTDLYTLAMQDPARLNNPRRIVIGLQFNF